MIEDLFTNTKGILAALSTGTISFFIWVFRRNHMRLDRIEQDTGDLKTSCKVMDERLKHIVHTQERHEKQNKYIIELLIKKKK